MSIFGNDTLSFSSLLYLFGSGFADLGKARSDGLS